MAILTAMLRRHVVVGILGARQVGKSTLARMVAGARRGHVAYFDLENDEDLARLSDPMPALKGLSGLVIIDEIQHRPDLFRALRVLADCPVSSCELTPGTRNPR
jgi:uncharacterized protein